MSMTHDNLLLTFGRLLGGNGDDVDDGGHHEFGVHIKYEDLYSAVAFLTAIYVSGQVFSKYLLMPDLVGEIICGIVLGPELLDFVPNPEAWVLFGELGLVLLVIEAGIDIDLSTLKLIGTRGCLIAILGSIFPIGLGMLIAYLLGIADTKAVIAAGAVFGPTSLGIALNILRGGGILNTPVGQLIISAAVIDDMIALVVLSQLQALSGTITIGGILIPIVSALAFLCFGGFIAIAILPPIIRKHILTRFDEKNHARVELGILFFLVLALMPATYYAKASYLMGCFVAGLTFCSFHELHHGFVRQFKRLLQWLMRVFFAASIGFQVPIKSFNNGEVIWQGFVFTLALIGKVGVGFLVPNFSKFRRFTGNHLRDCLITGYSMAAEGEFAFVIAVFAVGEGLIDKDLYAKVVLAVLLSTIVPPFLLRFTISYYNKQSQAEVQKLAEEEEERRKLGTDIEKQDEDLIKGIKDKSAIFLCIQTQSDSKWGLLNSIMAVFGQKGLDVIDHRAWSPRGVNTTLVNEVYARSQLSSEEGQEVENLIQDLEKAVLDAIDQPDAKVKVQRWYPGVIQEIVEETDEKSQKNIHHRLLTEAASALERRQTVQTLATRQKSMKELTGLDDESLQAEIKKAEDADATVPQMSAGKDVGRPRRRVRQKMRSTPVVGGGLFGETIEARSGRDGETRVSDFTKNKGNGMDWAFDSGKRGIPAEISIKGEVYSIRIANDTWRDLQKGFNGQMVDNRGIEISQMNIEATDDAPIVQRLTGFVRSMNFMSKIEEEDENSSRHGMDNVSEVSKEDASKHDSKDNDVYDC